MQDKAVIFLKSETKALNIRRPAFCCIGLSTSCSFRCKMCFLWKTNPREDRQEPALNEWYNFLAKLAEFTGNCVEINVSGGEPLLDERNLALISFSAKAGLPTSMPTNGFFINKEAGNKIICSGLNAIGISIDGIKPQTHNFLRGIAGSHEKAVQAIEYLHGYRDNLGIGIITTILENNLDEIISLAEWANGDKRIETIIFQAITQPFNTHFDSEWFNKSEFSLLWPQDIKKASDAIDGLIHLKKIGYKISNPVSQLEVFKRYFENPRDFIKKGRCNVDYYMNINQFGDVYMCALKDPIGNIAKDSPKEMWYSQKANRIRQEIRDCRLNCHHLVNCCYEEE